MGRRMKKVENHCFRGSTHFHSKNVGEPTEWSGVFGGWTNCTFEMTNLGMQNFALLRVFGRNHLRP